MAISLIGVPSSAGAFGVGQEGAPAALREAGLVSALAAKGVEVADLGDSEVVQFRPDPDHRKAQNFDRVKHVIDDVAARVAEVVSTGRLPVVLGGDCTITLGVLAGLLRADLDPVMAYLDGDPDLATPATTTSGIPDSMGMAHILDLEGADDRLAAAGGRRPLLDGHSLAMIGLAEELDDDEAAILKERSVHHVTASDVRADPATAVRRTLDALDREQPLVVHFDVDVVDAVDLPLGHVPHFNTGLSLADTTTCLTELCAAPNLAAVVVTEANPLNDPDGTQIPRLIETLATALAASADPT